MSIFHRYVAAPLMEGRAPRALAFLVAGIPLGIAWFVLLVTGWSLGLGLLITLLGIPVLLVLGVAVRGAAALERMLADALLGTRLAGGARPVWTGNPFRSLWNWLTDPASWREQAYLLLRFVVGLPLGIRGPRRHLPGPPGAHRPVPLLRLTATGATASGTSTPSARRSCSSRSARCSWSSRSRW